MFIVDKKVFYPIKKNLKRYEVIKKRFILKDNTVIFFNLFHIYIKRLKLKLKT